MPKDTFLNLPAKKRQKIIDSAIDEFALHHFDTASINTIIKNSNISKGSFYQYFEDKKDLFMYLLDYIVNKKMKYITPVMINPTNHDIFKVIREMYISGIKFARDNEKLSQIGSKFFSNKNHPLFIEIMEKNSKMSDNLFKTLLTTAIKNKDVKENIDISFVSHIISQLNVLMADYYLEYMDDDYGSNFMNLVDKTLDFIKNGIGYNKPEGGNNDKS